MEGSKAEEGNQTMKLYSHWMSSCSRRVRLALHLKGLKYDCINITSVGDPELLKVNPMGYVPALVDDTTVISDSYAILLYLDEKYPQYPLLPQDLSRKAINYQVASIVSSSIQPLQNTSLVNYIGEIVSPDEKIPWAQYHIRKGFVALEKLLTNYAGKYATGDEVYLADLYLAPQLDNAINRYKLDMTEFPLLSKLNKAYSELPSFQQMLAETQNLDADKIFGLVKKLAA
ncbi:glutathione S-transferase zeta class-like [Cynara cardunculus var. scolymus]|uniref:glutathione S-transferase zeta class-like n=1 Tax=Cynara cardunculus var. scolymus TaxID=59895 RepID=UPI000D628A3B|nr:glutathione S-transferase zeta class-like [Cynara cardunculus var. scolymus]